MYSGATEPSTGLISKWRVSSINTSPIIAAIQKNLSLKRLVNDNVRFQWPNGTLQPQQLAVGCKSKLKWPYRKTKERSQDNMTNRIIYGYIARARACSIGFGKSIRMKKSEGYR